MSGLSAMVDALILESFEGLSDSDSLAILAIRNEPEVRRNMYTDHEIGEEEHRAWMSKLGWSADTRMFAVRLDRAIIGAVGLTAMAPRHRRADWAFYLSGSTQGRGVGSALEFKFLNLAFDEFGLAKLNCEVLAFNEAVVALHRKFGFQLEGVRRSHVEREGERVDAILLGMLREEWVARRDELRQRLFRP